MTEQVKKDIAPDPQHRCNTCRFRDEKVYQINHDLKFGDMLRYGCAKLGAKCMGAGGRIYACADHQTCKHGNGLLDCELVRCVCAERGKAA